MMSFQSVPLKLTLAEKKGYIMSANTVEPAHCINLHPLFAQTKSLIPWILLYFSSHLLSVNLNPSNSNYLIFFLPFAQVYSDNLNFQ